MSNLHGQKLIEKILLGTKQLTMTVKKIVLVSIELCLNACQNLRENELNILKNTARDFGVFCTFFQGQA